MAKIAIAAGEIAVGVISEIVAPGNPFGVGLIMAGGASLAEMALAPHTQQQGPRLSDLSVSLATNGAPLPFGYGSFRYGGNIIWSPGLVEHSTTTTSGGKGGPSTTSTTYSYTASFAVSFGEGPGTIKKIWGDSKIIYDSAASSKYPAPTLYDGSQTQAADALIQADKGVAYTPAFRHQIYAVFEDFPLADFGNRIPNLRAEINFSIVTLSDMVADICSRAGLETSQIDVSAL